MKRIFFSYPALVLLRSYFCSLQSLTQACTKEQLSTGSAWVFLSGVLKVKAVDYRANGFIKKILGLSFYTISYIIPYF